MSILDDKLDPDLPPPQTPGAKQKFVKWSGRGNKKEVSADEILKEREAEGPPRDMLVETAAPIVDDDVAASFDAAAPAPAPAFTTIDARPKGVDLSAPPLAQSFPKVGDKEGFAPPDLSYKTARTLTDWLALCPGLRQPWETHPYRIRVERLTPKLYGGMRVGGFLGYERGIDDETFAIQYGGEKFRLTLEGPDPRGIADPNTGLARIRTLAAMDIEVPGTPNLQKLPLAVVAAAQQQQRMDNPMQFGPSSPFAPQQFAQPMRTDPIESKGILDITRDLLRNQMRDRDHGTDGKVLDAFGRMSEKQLDVAREAAAQSNAHLTAQLESERRRSDQLETRLNELQRDAPQQRMLELIAGGKMTNEEINRLRSEYDDKLDRQRRDYENQLTQKESQWQLRYDQAKGDWERREEMLRAEMGRKDSEHRDAGDRKERDLRDHYENKIRLDREMHDSRAKDQARDHERQINMLMENHRRETESLRRDNERDQKTQKQMSEMLVHSKDSELDRLRSENAVMKSEVDHLKRQVYKPFAEQLAETRASAETIGMISAADAAAAGDKEEKLSTQLVKMVVDKAPDLLRAGLPFLAGKMGVDPGAMAQMGSGPPPAGFLPNAGPSQQQQRQAPPPQQQQRRRVPVPPRRAPEPITSDDDQFAVSPEFVPLDGGYQPPPPMPMDPIPPPAPPPQQVQQPVAQAASPAPAQQAPAQPAQQGGPQISPAEHERLMGLQNSLDKYLSGPPPFPQEYLQQFSVEVTKARKDDMDPKAFAAAFVERAGQFAFMASDWIKDPEGGWIVLELLTAGQAGWSMAGPKMWMTDMLTELRRLKPAETPIAPA